MTLPLAIGAVVDGVPTTAQTPLSGHLSPVRAVVPSGTRFRVLWDAIGRPPCQVPTFWGLTAAEDLTASPGTQTCFRLSGRQTLSGDRSLALTTAEETTLIAAWCPGISSGRRG